MATIYGKERYCRGTLSLGILCVCVLILTGLLPKLVRSKRDTQAMITNKYYLTPNQLIWTILYLLL